MPWPTLPLYPSSKIKSITKSCHELTEKCLIIVTINLCELFLIWVRIIAPAEYKSQGKAECRLYWSLYAWDPQLVAHKMNPLATGGNPGLQAQHPSDSLGSGPPNPEKSPAELGGSPAWECWALRVRPHRAVSAVLSPAWHSTMVFLISARFLVIMFYKWCFLSSWAPGMPFKMMFLGKVNLERFFMRCLLSLE